jgi:hypothetical protein
MTVWSIGCIFPDAKTHSIFLYSVELYHDVLFMTFRNARSGCGKVENVRTWYDLRDVMKLIGLVPTVPFFS